MKRMRMLAALLWPSCLFAAVDPSSPETRPAGSREVSELQDYTRSLSKQWINQVFRIDVDEIGYRLKRRARAYSEVNLERSVPGSEGSALPTGQDPSYYALSLRLEQYDDFLRMTRDLQDIPFALRLDAEGRMFGGLPVQTRLFVPLSWKDELRAEATVPLPDMELPLFNALLDAIGLNSRWAIKSAYTNRLGLSSLQAGLATQWLSLWNFQYDYRVRFGQGEGDSSHWLKMERGF